MDGCRDQILDTLILISDPIKIQENQYQDQCLLLTEDLEFEGVSSKVVFVDSTMEVEYVANLSGSQSHYIVITVEQLQVLKNLKSINEEKY